MYLKFETFQPLSNPANNVFLRCTGVGVGVDIFRAPKVAQNFNWWEI